MKIRKATMKDLSKVLKLFNSDPNLIGNDGIKFNKNHMQEYLTNQVNKLIICEVNKRIVAAILTEFWKKAKYVYINDIIVDRNYRGQGIGFKLQSHIEQLAKKQGMKLIFLFSERENLSAHKMFLKGGFEKGKKLIFFSKELK